MRSKRSGSTSRRPESSPPPSSQAKERPNFSARGDGGKGTASRPGERQPRRPGGQELEGGLEEGMAREVALRRQLLDQPLERQVLMRHRRRGSPARTALDERREAGVAREVGAQHQEC